MSVISRTPGSKGTHFPRKMVIMFLIRAPIRNRHFFAGLNFRFFCWFHFTWRQGGLREKQTVKKTRLFLLSLSLPPYFRIWPVQRELRALYLGGYLCSILFPPAPGFPEQSSWVLGFGFLGFGFGGGGRIASRPPDTLLDLLLHLNMHSMLRCLIVSCISRTTWCYAALDLLLHLKPTFNATLSFASAWCYAAWSSLALETSI